jgi:SAM-dependent methyltransferase/glycosyltransferase involved in cell wall biosynthesis
VASACTIIARNYLAQARVLARSYFTHHPDGRFYLLVVDGLPAAAELDARIQLVDPHDLPVDNLYEMFFKYDVVELSTAVKPALLILLTERWDEERMMYIDPDVLITRPMTEVFEALDRADVVLTPHLNEPIPCDDRSPSEQDILISGAYNLGFIALRRSRETARFLDWWRERLNDLCRVEPSGGLMVDQRWIDLAPSLFPSAFILHDSTYNVAYWNLHARQIERSADGYACNGRPLVMFHFSGYDPERPDVLSKHQTRTELVAGTALHELFTAYGQAVLAAGFQESKRWGYDLATFDNGIGLHAIFRRLYLELDAETRRAFGDPFETKPEGSFFQWATTTQPGCRQLSPFLETAYRLRYDVQGVFPDVAGEHRLGFLRWAAAQGATEFGYEPELVLRCEPSLELPTGTPPSVAPARREQQAPADPAGGEASQASAVGNLAGVNVCGYLRNESGLGSAARGYIQILNSLGVPVSLRDVSELSANRSDDSSISVFHGDHPYPVNLVCVNADQHFVVMRQDPSFFENRYNIGVWFWELPSFPSEWHDRFDHYDEIWAGSSYIANTLAPLSPIPVVRIQPLLGPQLVGNRRRGRDRLGIGNEFLFLFMFDFHSYFQRKNPLAVVEAFRQAFAPTDGARLVVKSVNGSSSVSEADMLKTAIGADCRITLIDGYISSAEVADLTSACDCYVSLHRAEGMGLTMAHAMAAGKPAIATGWSGNTDFMDASNSLLVRFDLVELEHDVGPYKAGATWAEPDIDHASALMRHLFDRPDEAAALGLAAQRDLAARFSVERIGQVAAARLQVVADRLAQPRLRAAPVTIQHAGNAVLMGAIRRIVAEAVGQDSRPVAVVSKGDPVLIDLSDHPGWHFPQDDDGVYAGYYPGDSDTAVAHLEQLRQRGAGYFLVPATCRWWLSHYRGLRHHLDTHYQLVAEDMSCVLYRLDWRPEDSPRPIDEQPDRADSQPTFEDLQRQIEHLRATLAATGDWVSDLAPRVAGGERRLSAIPPVLREAFASVAHTVGEIESDLEDRMVGIERAHGDLAGLITETTAQLHGLASQVESSCGSQARQLVAAQDVDRRLEELESRSSEQIDGIADRLTTLSAEVAELARHRRALERRPDMRALAAGKARVRNNELIANAPELVDGDLGRVSVVERRLASRPYMSTDRFFTDDPDRALGFSRDDSREAERADRPTFADAFRGERSFVADRQRAYLAFFNECTLVVDLGCGRGEFLELLAHQGVLAMGVDLDGSLVRACQRRGLRVQQQDALAFLQHAAPASVDGIFSAQFIEHVDPSQLLDLLVWARRALQAGGTFVAETVNPENYEALKAFYVDLTHQRPIFPQVLLHLCWEAGFEAAWIFYPEGGGFTQRCYDSVGEYAVVARA